MTNRERILELFGKGLSTTRISKELDVEYRKVKAVIDTKDYQTEKTKIINLRLKGKSYSEIRRELGCSAGHISRCCSQHIPNNNQIAKQLYIKNKPKCRFNPRLASDQDITEMVKKCNTLSEVGIRLGYKIDKGYFRTLLLRIKKLGLDTSHFIGKTHKIENPLSHPKSRRRYLLKLRGHQCSQCKRKRWYNQSIPLDVHHVNGDRNDNKIENLVILCPNCHRLQHN